MLKGIAASPGIEKAKIYCFEEKPVIINKNIILSERIEAEIKRFNESLKLSKKQLEKIKGHVQKETGKDEAEIFEAQIMILEDILLTKDIIKRIKEKKITAEHAVDQIVEEYVSAFENIQDEYIKERRADIKDVGMRIIKNILGINIMTFEDIDESIIVIAKDLTPSETAHMNKKIVKAFATDMGGRTSHTAIMAKNLGIPAVVGLGEISKKVKNGDIAIVDGIQGLVFINPDKKTIDEYNIRKKKYDCMFQESIKLKDEKCETLCKKRRIEIVANIGTPEDYSGALEYGAEGVGLYRSEFLYMDRKDLPNEEEQFEAYKFVTETTPSHPIIIRTLDIGGDKKLPYWDMPYELNPFLGWRAIRICLDKVDMFKTQLRAILRASNFGNIRIMYPMISSKEEIFKANKILQQAKEELDREGKPYNKNIEVGIMIEIPSAAILADILIKHVDFFSIGSNDLIQYTLAVDRTNENISDLYEPFHPAILRLIKNVIDASHKEGKWTGICGEMAGDVCVVPILLGMGIDELSMSPVSIPWAKKVIRSLTYKQAKELAQKALDLSSSQEIKKLVQEYCMTDNFEEI